MPKRDWFILAGRTTFAACPCLCPLHRDEDSSSWVAPHHIQLPAAGLAQSPVPSPKLCNVSPMVQHALSSSGGLSSPTPLAESQSGCELRCWWNCCAGACSWDFWLAGATGARSPPGQQPNGMAGWLPALALIAASLRFEVTRSFQSFISRPLFHACNDTEQAASPPPLPACLPSSLLGKASLLPLRPGHHQLMAPHPR